MCRHKRSKTVYVIFRSFGGVAFSRDPRALRSAFLLYSTLPWPGLSNVLLSHTFVIWREIYGTMGADKDEVKDLQRSTKKTECTKKSKR